MKRPDADSPFPKACRKRRNGLRLLSYVLTALLLTAACANPSTGPDGGPYDETPPVLLSVSPEQGSVNTYARRITLTFDEYISLNNASEKVIVSPPQLNLPSLTTSGKHIHITLQDSLKPNTTYTIDFSDAIRDYNESNPFGNFTHIFSTGDAIDTMEVAGYVLSAEDLNPVASILVGLHSDTIDTAFHTKPFDRVARTDAQGHFSIKGVAPGQYRIFALNDIDGDFLFTQKSEQIAFSDKLLSPSCFPDTRRDTIWHDSIYYDSIRIVPFTHFLPDDVILLAFTEKATSRHLLKTSRENPENFSVYFTASSEIVPEIRGLNFDAEGAFLEVRSSGNDTLTYWLADTVLLAQDTLAFALTYDATDDSTRLRYMKTDTLRLVPRNTMEKRRKKQQQEREEWEKKEARRKKRNKDAAPTAEPKEYIRLTNRLARTLAPTDNINLYFSEPLRHIDESGIHLLLGPDSAKVEAPFLIERDERNVLHYTLYGEWREGQEYALRIDSMALLSVFYKENKSMEGKFRIGNDNEYGTLYMVLPKADSTAVVQLLSSESKIYRQKRVEDGVADFYYLTPGKYYIRLFRDRNNNGRWDTGEYDAGLQAEEVRYFPQEIQIKANWDIEQEWNPEAKSLLEQKPNDLRKRTNTSSSNSSSAHERNLQRLRERSK